MTMLFATERGSEREIGGYLGREVGKRGRERGREREGRGKDGRRERR